MKHYGWKFLRLFVVSLAILGFTSACGTTTKTAKTAKTTITTMSITSAPTIYSHMPFKPDYFDDTPAKGNPKHVVVFYRITPAGIVFLGIPPIVRTGPFIFPYNETLGSTTHERTGGGDTKISYFDASGVEIGHYYIESPVITRRCEGPLTGSGIKEKQPRPPTVDPVNKPEELLLPYDTNITSVQIITPIVAYSRPNFTIP